MTLTELERLHAAQTGDENAFAELVAPHERALHAHCRRLLDTPEDGEDAMQETLLRAWRALPRFEGRCSVRTWLHRIATNCALNMLARRTVPIEPESQALLDREVEAPSPTPEASAEEREVVSLALLVAHQHLPPRQRAALILRDGFDLSAGEVATSLRTTTASVNSALQRARATVAAHRPTAGEQPSLVSLDDARLRTRVGRCADAWARGDVAGVVAMLAAEAA
jgi:RNA polymerase sigma-70 factor (ECF subfamily)